MGCSFPVTPSNGASLECSAPGDFPFPETGRSFPEFALVVSPATGFGKDALGVDTGVVTPPDQEETEIFLGSWIQGSQPLYHAVPINAPGCCLAGPTAAFPLENLV